jgi:hypothetical protein
MQTCLETQMLILFSIYSVKLTTYWLLKMRDGYLFWDGGWIFIPTHRHQTQIRKSPTPLLTISPPNRPPFSLPSTAPRHAAASPARRDGPSGHHPRPPASTVGVYDDNHQPGAAAAPAATCSSFRRWVRGAAKEAEGGGGGVSALAVLHDQRNRRESPRPLPSGPHSKL